MKKIKYGFLIVLLFMTIGCNSNKDVNIDTKHESTNQKEANESMKVVINEKEYQIVLEDNETVKNFINYLPQELKMNELNGNEKYAYLDISLPTNPLNPQRINAGDVMLYGDNCLVIFYKSFATSYSYTKIGHIEDLPDLGNGNITIKIIK